MMQALALRLAYLPVQLPIRAWRFVPHVFTGIKKLVGTRPGLLLTTNAIGYWWFEFSFLLLDLLCVPEFYETAMDIFKGNTSRLTNREVEVAQSVFGTAIDYRRVRKDERAVVACRKHHIIYVSFHTINSWGSYRPDLLIHELVHVWQYRKFGAVYIPKALKAQFSPEGYNYGGVENLRKCLAGKGSLLDFNLEQQADIISDYFRIREGGPPCWGNGSKVDLPVYESFVHELRTL